MHSRILLIGLIIAALKGGCSTPSDTRITPPKVPEGGRTLSIAVTSTDDKRMVVATETGGLFRSFDGGKNWQHLNGLPNNRTRDVAFAFLDPNTIIATTDSQYRGVNDGGIWRSQDGGASWSQPTGWFPPAGPTCIARPSAYGISHMPLSRTFFVGTDCGIAVSNDNGATWSNFILDPSATGMFAHRVRSVLVLNRSSGVAAADRGLFFIGPNNAWTKSQVLDNSSQVPVLHAFSAPFFLGSSNVFFHAGGGQKLFVSSDAGRTWSQIPAPSNNNREAFVRVARSVTGDDQKFDVYFGDGVRLHRQSFTFPALEGGDWTQLKSDHADPSDIAFDLDRRIPVLLATDGGVHLTTDKGANWKLTGGGSGGLNALQITEVVGQAVSGSSPHLDLYYSTQDNGIRGSSDGGQTWTSSVDGEGRFLAVTPASFNHDVSAVTGLQCGNCKTFMTDAHFANRRGFPNAPVGDVAASREAPFQIFGDVYLQYVTNDNTSPVTFDAFMTLSAGSFWRKSYTLPLEPRGIPAFAGFLANPTAFQGVQRPGSLPNGGTRFGLFRIQNLAGQPSVTAIDTKGIGSFGSLRTPISRRVVFGVDPKDRNHLLAADAQNNEMKYSDNGGASWFHLPKLTQAVTDNGKYMFTLGDLTFATVIAWDPVDSCHILVGTMQNGVIRSTDGGHNWTRVAGSASATEVTSFYFPPTGPVWVSTNGRGLFNLNLNRRTSQGTCRFPISPSVGEPLDGVVVLDHATGESKPFSGPLDPAVCATCTLVVVRNGWVTDVDFKGDSIQQLAISGGTISAIDRYGREVKLDIPNRYQSGEGRAEWRKAARGSKSIGARRVRALLLEGNRLRKLIAATDELPFTPARTPLVIALSAAEPSRAGILPGELVRVTGSGFVPPAGGGQAVQIFFDDELVARAVPVRDDGSFSIDIRVRQLPGEVVVTVEQRDGVRITRERTTIEVMRQD